MKAEYLNNKIKISFEDSTASSSEINLLVNTNGTPMLKSEDVLYRYDFLIKFAGATQSSRQGAVFVIYSKIKQQMAINSIDDLKTILRKLGAEYIYTENYKILGRYCTDNSTSTEMTKYFIGLAFRYNSETDTDQVGIWKKNGEDFDNWYNAHSGYFTCSYTITNVIK